MIRIWLSLILLSSCSIFSQKVEQVFTNYNPDNLYKYEGDDFVDHLSSLAGQYVNSRDVKIIKLNSSSRKYLEKRYREVLKNNELLLNNKEIKPKFYIVKNITPFSFSLPGGHFFFSLGLIKKYLRNEQVFMAVLTYEIIRVHRNIYKKKSIIPIGYLRTERLLSLIRLDLESRVELGQWTFHSLQRAEFDPSAYLIWLQTQNRNILDFSLQRGGSRGISREEFTFKNFVAEQNLTKSVNTKKEFNSSKEFYKMLNYLERVRL